MMISYILDGIEVRTYDEIANEMSIDSKQKKSKEWV